MLVYRVAIDRRNPDRGHQEERFAKRPYVRSRAGPRTVGLDAFVCV
jgi:hypothetical protein